VHTDPAILLWQEWHNAYERFMKLCTQQNRLETKVFSMIPSYPSLSLQTEGRDEPVLVSARTEIDRWLPGPEHTVARKCAKAKLSRLFNAWQRARCAANEATGYSRVKEAEADASNRADELANVACNTPARSIAGVIAKLHIILTLGEPSQGTDEYPYPQIRLVLTDLLHIDTHTDTL